MDNPPEPLHSATHVLVLALSQTSLQGEKYYSTNGGKIRQKPDRKITSLSLLLINMFWLVSGGREHSEGCHRARGKSLSICLCDVLLTNSDSLWCNWWELRTRSKHHMYANVKIWAKSLVFQTLDVQNKTFTRQPTSPFIMKQTSLPYNYSIMLKKTRKAENVPAAPLSIQLDH